MNVLSILIKLEVISLECAQFDNIKVFIIGSVNMIQIVASNIKYCYLSDINQCFSENSRSGYLL